MRIKTNKKRILVTLILFLALLLPALLGAVPGLQAKAEEAESGIGYYVRALLPDNQINDNLTYFDLRMQPGQIQVLEVEVVNEADEAITVSLAAISASTNRNGIIDYKTPDIRDKTLLIPFSEIAELESGSLTIAPGSTAMARVTLAMPDAIYDGVVLGGLVFTRQPDESAAGEGLTLQNVYSYVIGVKLSETDTEVLPEFELESVQTQAVNYQPAMVHYFRNTAAAIAKDINIRAMITDADGNVVAEIERNGVDMAPNSVMQLAVTPGGTAAGGASQAQNTGQLVPGDYTSDVVLEQGGTEWAFQQKFTIGSVEAGEINNARPGNPPVESGLSPSNWMIILVLVLAAVILTLLIIVITLLRRRKDGEEKNIKPGEAGQRTKELGGVPWPC